jgi:hypothetical protein
MSTPREIVVQNAQHCLSPAAARYGTPQMHTLYVCKSALAASVAARPREARFAPEVLHDYGNIVAHRAGRVLEVDLAAFLPNKHKCFAFARSFLREFATQPSIEGDKDAKNTAILLNVHPFLGEDGVAAFVSLLGEKHCASFVAVLHVQSMAGVPPALASRCVVVRADPSVEQLCAFARNVFEKNDLELLELVRRCRYSVDLLAAAASSLDPAALLGASSALRADLDAFVASACSATFRKTTLEAAAAKAARLVKRNGQPGVAWKALVEQAVELAATSCDDATAREAAALFARADHLTAQYSNAGFHAATCLLEYWLLLQIFHVTSNKTKKPKTNGRTKAPVGSRVLEHDP